MQVKNLIKWLGKYIPSIAEYILRNNIKINVAAILVGDGFTNPDSIQS